MIAHNVKTDELIRCQIDKYKSSSNMQVPHICKQRLSFKIFPWPLWMNCEQNKISPWGIIYTDCSIDFYL